MQRKSNHIAIQAQSKSLSIQFSLGGFSFCVVNSATKQPIFLGEYTFENSLETPEKLLEKVEHIFSTETQLQQDFEEITVIHQNNLATLVPTPFFDETKLKDYLQFNIKTLATDFIAYDDLNQVDVKNVYVPYVNINNYIFQNFGEFEYKHHTTALIDKLLQENTEQKTMFVNVGENSLDIVITEGNNLLLSNSFSFYTKEDFIYYILFVAEQLQLNTEEFPLVFLGDIEEDSEIYTLTYQYVRNVLFYEVDNAIVSTSTDFSKHSHFILVG